MIEFAESRQSLQLSSKILVMDAGHLPLSSRHLERKEFEAEDTNTKDKNQIASAAFTE